MDRGLGSRIGDVSTRLYRVEFAILGGWRVAGGGNVGDLLHKRQDRRDGVAGSHTDWCGSISPAESAYYLGGV
jgi:hypothetical protein